jgi:hypothetical protein
MKKKLSIIRNNQIDILESANAILDKVIYLNRFENSIKDTQNNPLIYGIASQIQKASTEYREVESRKR